MYCLIRPYLLNAEKHVYNIIENIAVQWTIIIRYNMSLNRCHIL